MEIAEFKEKYYEKFPESNVEILDEEIRKNPKRGNRNELIRCRCKKDGYEWYETIRYLNNGKECPVCSGHKIKIGVNDLWTTYPEIASLLKNKEEGYYIQAGTRHKYVFVCPECGNEKYDKPSNIILQKHFVCKSCSDGISFPNKFMFNLLKNLNVIFETEKTFKECNIYGKKYYDFFVENLEMIIEMNGLQHYERQYSKNSRTLEEEQENDKIKKELALKNGIKYYIEIDCRYSDPEFIIKNIKDSELSKILNLENVDWNEITRKSFKTRVKQVSDLWNEGKNIKEICNICNFSEYSVRNCLKKGTTINLCVYEPKKEMEKTFNEKKISVICLETKEIFESVTEAAKAKKVSFSAISNCCKKEMKNINTCKDNHYLYFEDYDKMSNEEIEKILLIPSRPKPKKIICIETNQIFENLKEAKTFGKTSRDTINKYLRNETDHAGLHPETKEPLHWRYANEGDYVLLQ